MRYLQEERQGMMEQDASNILVRKIMLEFADLTGLSSAREVPQRYLWTRLFCRLQLP